MRKLITIICLFVLTFNVSAQAQRFLEKKGFEEKTVSMNTMSQVSVSVNEASDKLAVTSSDMEMDTKVYTAVKSKTFTYAKILNLLDGRLEFNSPGFMLGYVGNDLLYSDYTAYNGRWIRPDKEQIPFHFIDPVTKVKIEIPIPEGYHLSGYHGQYVFTTNYEKMRAIVLEKTPEGFRKKHELKMIMPRASGDGSVVFGRVGFTSNQIVAYSMENGEVIGSVNPSKIPSFYNRLKNGNWVMATLTDCYIMDSNSNVLFVLKDAGKFFELNSGEDRLISVNDNGSVKIWDTTTGKLLSEITDTHIALANSSKQISVPIPIAKGKFYLIGYSTGIVSLIDMEHQKVIANLFFDGPDWAVIAKDGRIDGTTGAFEKLEWQEFEGGKMTRQTSVESSFDKYYTPRLLHTLLTEEITSVASVTLTEDMDKRPVLTLESINENAAKQSGTSVISFESKQKNIPIRFAVTRNPDRVKEVRLYHNGKLTGVQKTDASNVYTFNVTLTSTYGPENSLYAIASNVDGIDSEKCKAMIIYNSDTGEKPRLFALVIGINKYQNPKYELNYAQPDAEAVHAQLLKSKSALFETIEVKTLFGDKATKTNINNAFKELSGTIKEQDIFIFYYAGHGTMTEGSASQNFYIVPHDVTQLYGNESLLKEKALSANEIRTLSMTLNAQKQVFIIDACHSAEALNSAVTRGAAEERAIGQLARSTGTFWLTAAGSDQFATEFEQIGHGVFTFSLLEALQGKDAGSMADGTITIRELSSYIEQRVPELSQKYKGKPQYPASFSFGNDFPIMIFNSK